MADRSPAHGPHPLHIAYWCQFFWPEPSAPSRRLLDFGRLWRQQGHHVTVVTAMPNHPTGIIPPEYRGKVLATEAKDGLRVLRSWVYASPNQAGIKKLLGHLSFAATSVLNGARLGRTDVVIASSPTFFVVFSAWLVARTRRAMFVFEVRDLWPEAFVDLGVIRKGVAIGALGRLVRFLYRRADLIVVVTESFATRIAAQGIPAAKIATITNGADIDWFATDVSEAAAQRRRDLGLQDKFVVAYIGAHGVSHSLMTVLQAAERCPNDRVVFLFVGDGSDKPQLEAYKAGRHVDNVLMLPSQPSESVREYYALSDVCLVPLRDVALFEAFVPSKMFEIMAAGRPIIAGVRGEARRILEASGGAIVVDPEKPDALVGAVTKLIGAQELRREMGGAGRRFVAANYSRRALAERYARLLADHVS